MDAVEFGHARIGEIIGEICVARAKAGKRKREFPVYLPCGEMQTFVDEVFGAEIARAMRVTSKLERKRAFDSITRTEAFARVAGHKPRTAYSSTARGSRAITISTNASRLDEEEELRTMVVDEGLRPGWP